MTSRLDLDEYIICTNNCNLRFLEALAMNGFAVKSRIEDCEKPRHKKIILELFDGREVTSQCRFEDEVKQSIRIINIYIGFARKNKAWEKLGVIEGKPEE